VRHGGREVSLSPNGARSNALAGTPLGGPWVILSPLTPDEQVNPAQRPLALELLATLRCRADAR
jgi:hypothetical protein